MNLELWDEKGTEFAPLSDDMLVYRGNSLVIGDRTFEHEGGCTVKLLKEAIEKSRWIAAKGNAAMILATLSWRASTRWVTESTSRGGNGPEDGRCERLIKARAHRQ